MSRYLQQNKRAFLVVSSVLLVIATIGLAGSLFPFDIRAIRLSAIRMRQYSPLLTLACVYLAAAFFAVYRILQHLEGQVSLLGFSAQVGISSSKDPFPRLGTLIGVGLVSLFILGQSIAQLGTPLDWDEMDTITRLVSPQICPVDEKNPYQNRDVISPSKNTRNHPIASVASWMIMKVIGVGPQRARLPAVFFTLGFLVVFFTWGLSLFSPAVILFTLLHLSINGLFIWYTHSMRGYISMSLFCLIALFLVIQSPHQAKRFSNLALLACGFACGLTHTFGGIFYVLLILSYLFWIATESPRMSESDVKAHWRRLMFGTLPIPLIVHILFHQYFFLSHIGYLYATLPLERPEPLTLLLGVRSSLASLFLAGWIVTLAVASFFRRGQRDVLTVFLALSTITFSILLLSLKTTLFEARFLLAFVPPFVLWAARTIESISSPGIRGAFIASGLAFLVVLPVQGRSGIYNARTEKMAAFNSFIGHAKTITTSVDSECVSARGDADEARFTRGLFFFRSKEAGSTSCERRFITYFSRDWKGEHPISPFEKVHLTELFHDEMGRALYEEHFAPGQNRLAQFNL
jgi:hypothetical protein